MNADRCEYLPEPPELIIIDLDALEHPCMSADSGFDDIEEEASLMLARNLIVARSAREAKGRSDRWIDKKRRSPF